MVGGTGRRFVVIVAAVGVRMKMAAADDRQELRLVVARRRLNMPVMPAAADERVHEQRDGGEGGDQRTHVGLMAGRSVDGTQGVSPSSARIEPTLKPTSSLTGKSAASGSGLDIIVAS